MTDVTKMSVEELRKIATNGNWCSVTHGHGLSERIVAAANELARRAELGRIHGFTDYENRLHVTELLNKVQAWAEGTFRDDVPVREVIELFERRTSLLPNSLSGTPQP